MAGIVEGGTKNADAVVRARDVQRTFVRAGGTPVHAIDGVSLDVRSGEFVVLLGPSGCGKTTLLRAIAGLEKPDSGVIHLRDRKVFDSGDGTNLPPESRRISMIFQSYALWPHMSAFDNVAYPLRSRGVNASSISARVGEALERVGIGELGRQFPAQLSGGQQQRVALARAIVAGDSLVLFDEPLSNVDARVREQLRIELLAMQRKLGFSALYVTHDQSEAMALAHRVAVMRQGKIVQIGPPREVYEEPATRYVANFIGTSNEIEGKVEMAPVAGRVKVNTVLGSIDALAPDSSIRAGEAAVLVFRPERCRLEAEKPAGVPSWNGTVEASLFFGSHAEHIVSVGGVSLRVWGGDTRLHEAGSPIWFSIEAGAIRAVSPTG
jgi:iron(III) transport system ATP-binding protein